MRCKYFSAAILVRDSGLILTVIVTQALEAEKACVLKKNSPWILFVGRLY